MADLLVIAMMAGCGLVPFALLVWLMRRGRVGAAMTVLAVLGACLVVLIYATGRPFGLNPVQAMTWALLFVVPALAGGGAGALLGWMLRRRDDLK